MRNRLLLTVALVMVLFGSLVTSHILNTLFNPLPIEDTLTFQVEKGSSLYGVLLELKNEGLIKDVQIARLYARFSELEQIRAGEFLLEPGMSLSDVIQRFNSNDVIHYRVTLIEGLRFQDYLAQIQQLPKVKSVINGWDNEQILAALGAKETHPEGLFAPETYSYTAGQSDLEILTQAYKRQQSILQDAWSKRAEGIPLASPYEVLILASMVEKETGAVEERADIAGVFTRRLIKGMRLQSDPTTIYGLGERYQGNLKLSHLREKNAYNTYKINGLPVTPIANPGAAAIYATTMPASGKSLYFVAKGDGSHYFSNTLIEHNEAVRKYQVYQRSKSYQSNPDVDNNGG